MTEIKFIKDHPSRKFKKDNIVEVQDANVDAWIKSGYAVINKAENVVGKVTTSSENGGGDSKSKSNKQSTFGSKKKKRNKKNKR